MSEQQITLRLISNSKEAGVIIGKGGENIKSLRSETGTQIHISSSAKSSSEQIRIIKVTGTKEGVTNCASLMCKKWGQLGEDKVNVKVLVPSSQCSSLIGKGGSNIKKIRDSTGTLIHIPSENLPNSTEKGVSISGTSHAVTDAIFGICSNLIDNPSTAFNVSYDPNAPQMERGLNSRDINPTVAQESSFGLSRIVESLSGGPVIGKPLVPKSKFSGPSDPIKEELYVPSDAIGCLIGKGGSTIAEIRHLSDCTIRIVNDNDEKSGSNKYGKKTVIMSGDKEAVEVAKSLISLTLGLNNMKRVRGTTTAYQNHKESTKAPPNMKTSPWEEYETNGSKVNLLSYPELQAAILMASSLKRESGHGYADTINSNDMQRPQYKKFRPNGQ